MPSQILVMKFGGTSVGTPEAMRQAAEIVRQERSNWPRLVVVTSALSGITNLLLESATQAVQCNERFYRQAAETICQKHAAVADAIIPDPVTRQAVMDDIAGRVTEFTNLCHAIYILGEATPRALDAVASLGERMSVRLLAAGLESLGVTAQVVESTQLIITDEQYMNAHPDLPTSARLTRQVLEPMLAGGIVPVVTGFIGATPNGVTTTLGRGGSDYSAALLGAALPADEVWIWTDVDGIMTADPRLVPTAHTIDKLSYREVAELAYFGAKVLHPKTILPVIEAGIGLRVCNTFNPAHPGTRLIADYNARGTGRIKAVTAINKLSLVTLEGRGMLGVPGVAARTFGAVATTGTSVPLITQASSEQSICFAIPIDAAPTVIAALEKAFIVELANHDIDRIWASPEMVIVTVVGAGMIHTPGIAGRVFTALGQRNVNVIAIAQGSTEVSISLVLDAADTEAGVRALHELVA